ncbi:MAG TPA: peptide ABC transporter substrate-binding protein [Candidatus Saccharimonadales bacterium]|nr:peptide ABC transporter substrate-binding protein [Candidatus Saccharimonadales bacterium]
MIRSPISQLQEIAPSKRTLKGHLRRIERVSLRHAHKFIVRRIANLREVRRHAFGWLVLVALLSGVAFWQSNVAAAQYTTDGPAEGGVFTEGVFGAVDNLNPIFAATPAERSASRLLFANLLSYDDNGGLVGELAQTWRLDETGKVFTMRLRETAKWQDGAPVTSDDVIFTFELIKNADTRSPLYASWRNIAIEKIDKYTVRFTLPAVYAAFANSLVVGILPQHVLKDVRPSELRTEPFNRSPNVVSGPFTFQALSAVDANRTHYAVRMAANKNYVLGAPKLNGFQLHAYKDREDLSKALRNQEVASISDPTINQLKTIDKERFATVNAPLDNGVYAFLKTDSELLSDVRVRQALQLATDQPAITKLFDGTVQELNGPLLPGQLGYRADLQQPSTNLARANQLLDEAGWKRNSQGTRRVKDGQPLKLRLVSLSSGNYPALAESVMAQWSKIGVEFDTTAPLVKADDIQQNVILPRAYDVLIYEIAIGHDPDVYAYWHSSQATERGFNLSDYKSPKVDDALDSARTRLDPALRAAKYQLFVQQWLADVPAIGLYRPSLVYVQNKDVFTFAPHRLVDPSDRYFNVRYWAAGHVPLRPTR